MKDYFNAIEAVLAPSKRLQEALGPASQLRLMWQASQALSTVMKASEFPLGQLARDLDTRRRLSQQGTLGQTLRDLEAQSARWDSLREVLEPIGGETAQWKTALDALRRIATVARLHDLAVTPRRSTYDAAALLHLTPEDSLQPDARRLDDTQDEVPVELVDPLIELLEQIIHAAKHAPPAVRSYIRQNRAQIFWQMFAFLLFIYSLHDSAVSDQRTMSRFDDMAAEHAQLDTKLERINSALEELQALHLGPRCIGQPFVVAAAPSGCLLRVQASPEGRTVATASINQQVTVLAKQGRWVLVTFVAESADGTAIAVEGWVRKDYLLAVDTAAPQEEEARGADRPTSTEPGSPPIETHRVR